MVDSVIDVTSLITQRNSKEPTQLIPSQSGLDLMITFSSVYSTNKPCLDCHSVEYVYRSITLSSQNIIFQNK